MKTVFSLKPFVLPLSFIVGLNLVVKLVMFCLMYHGQDILGKTKLITDSDEVSYNTMAGNVVNYHTYAPLKDTIDVAHFPVINKPHILCLYHDSLRLPGYPTFLSIIYFIIGIKPYIAVLLQILISLLSVVLIYRICILVSSSPSVASLAGLLYAIDIHSAYVASELLTDTLCVFCMLASVYYFLKAIKDYKLLPFLLSALFLGLASIVRPVMLLYPFILLFIFFIFNKQVVLRKLTLSASYLAVCYVFLLAWSFRNHAVYNHWQLTTQSGYNLVMWNSAFAESRITGKNVDSVRLEFQKQADAMNFNSAPNAFYKADIYEKIGYAYFKQHPLAMIAIHLEGGLHMFLSVGNVDIATSWGWQTPNIRGFPDMNMQRISKNFSGGNVAILAVVILVVMFLQYISCIIGLIRVWRLRNYMLLSLCILTIAYFILVIGVAGMYRYKLTITPFLCILAGFAFYKQNSLKDTH